jgi:GNAT superfamily N-acetyltransferase
MVTLRDLAIDPDDELLRRFHSEVLVPYFSPGELVPVSVLEAGLRSEPRDTDVVVAIDDDGAVVGGAVGDWDGGSGVYLLSYLAVRATLRSRGLGTLLMDTVRAWWEARGAAVAVAEVDDPRHHDASDYGDPVARLRFYERIGADVLAVPYTQPEVRAGSGRVPGMLLITFLVSPDARDGDGMRSDVLRRFLANYLSLSEGVAPENLDSEVDALVPALKQREASVRILPMARYIDI